MEDGIKSQIEQKSLISDEYFYRNIFKKTEKIVSAVFFLISKRQTIPAENVVRADLERRAKDTHSVALSLLNMEMESASYGMQTFLHNLVSLDSILRIYAAMGGISGANLQILNNEIEGVERSLRRYLGGNAYVLEAITSSLVKRTATRTVNTTSGSSKASELPTLHGVTAATPAASADDRISRILAVVRDSNGVGIKDIHAVVSDCSEKTIQRDLMTLIENGLVKREGERRWSQYFAT